METSIAARGQEETGPLPRTQDPSSACTKEGAAATGSRRGAPAVTTVEGVRAQAVAQAPKFKSQLCSLLAV